MSTGKIRAGGAEVELSTKDRYSKGLERAQARLKGFASSVSSMGRKVMMVGAAIGAPILASAVSFAAAGDEVHKMAIRTGVAEKQLSSLGFAAEQSGSSLSALGTGFRMMQKTIDAAENGGAAAEEALARVGMKAADLRDLRPDQQLRAMADGIASIQSPATRTAAALMIFGRGGAELLPMLSAGSEGIAEMQRRAQELGLTLDSVDAASAAAMTDAMNEAKRAAQGLANAVGFAVAPAITHALTLMADMTAKTSAWVRENAGLVQTLGAMALALGGAAGALLSVAVAAKTAAFALGPLKAIAALAMAAGTALAGISAPALGVAAAVAAVAAVFTIAAKNSGIMGTAFGQVAKVFNTLKQTASDTLGGVLNFLKSGEYKAAAQTLWAGIKLAFFEGVAQVLENMGLLWSHGLSGALAFGKSLAQLLGDIFRSIPKLLKSALFGGASFAQILGEAISGGMSGVTAAVDSQIAKSRAELDALRSHSDALEAKRSAASAAGAGGGGRGQGGESDEFETPKTAEAIRGRIAALRDETRATLHGRDAAERMKFATEGATRTQLAQLEHAQRVAAQAQAMEEARKKTEQLNEAVADRIQSVQDELVTLRHGAEAAERYKLAQMGATAEQLRAVASAQKMAAEARKASEMKDAGDALRDAMRNPLELFRDEMTRFRELAGAGAIDQSTVARAKKQARESLLKALGDDDLAREVADAERQRIKALVAAGKLNQDAAERALTAFGALLNEAAERAGKTQDQITDLANQGTFSGFAAARLSAPASKAERAQVRAAAAAEKQVGELQGLRADLRRNRPAFG